MLDQIHFPDVPVTVWIDDAGRLRKMRLVMDLGAVVGKLGGPAGVDPKIDMTFELYDFGAPVSVTAPAGAKPFVAGADNAAKLRGDRDSHGGSRHPERAHCGEGRIHRRAGVLGRPLALEADRTERSTGVES